MTKGKDQAEKEVYEDMSEHAKSFESGETEVEAQGDHISTLSPASHSRHVECATHINPPISDENNTAISEEEVPLDGSDDSRTSVNTQSKTVSDHGDISEHDQRAAITSDEPSGFPLRHLQNQVESSAPPLSLVQNHGGVPMAPLFAHRADPVTTFSGVPLAHRMPIADHQYHPLAAVVTHNEANTGNHDFTFSQPFEAPWTALHGEIQSFHLWVDHEKSKFEIPIRQAQHNMVQVLTQLTLDIFNEVCSVRVSGSASSNLNLHPPLSNLDLVIECSHAERSLEALPLQHLIRHLPADSSAEFIPSPIVPIIKVKYMMYHMGLMMGPIDIDISLNVKNVDASKDFIVEAIRQYRSLQPMVLFLKAFLKTHHLNSPYQGGVGSFLLQNMVLHIIQVRHIRSRTHEPLLTDL